MGGHTQHLKRVLLVRNDRIGDLVLTLPAFAAARQFLPQARLTALVSSYAGPLIKGCPHVDEILEDDPAEQSGTLARRLKSQRFDAALVFNTNTRNCLAVWRAGIRTRVCWSYKAPGFLLGNRRVAVHRSHPPIHEAEFALAFVKRLGFEASLADFAPRLAIEPEVRRRALARITAELGTAGPLFGVHPGNKKSAYNWPLDRYVELVCRLSEHGRVLVTGAPAEAPLLAEIAAGAANRRDRVATISDFSLPELAAAIGEQTALTVSSTGPMHVAGVVDTPVVALFSPHPAHVPAKWAPLGQGHTILVAPLTVGEDDRIPPEQADAVMSRISLDSVVEANLRYARGDKAAYSSAHLINHHAA